MLGKSHEEELERVRDEIQNLKTHHKIEHEVKIMAPQMLPRSQMFTDSLLGELCHSPPGLGSSLLGVRFLASLYGSLIVVCL